MNKKKIIFVLPRLHTNIIPLIKLLELKDFEVHILAIYSYIGKHAEEHAGIKVQIVNFSKVVKIIPNKYRLKLGIPSLTCLRKIYDIQPDLVIVREFLPSASYVHFFSKLLKIPTIMYTQKYMYGYNPSFMRKIYQNLLFPKNVFTTSPGNILLKENNSYTTKRNWKYIPFISEVNNLASTRSYFVDDKINIITVGKFTERKKILDFLKIFNKLCKERSDLKLTIVGSVLDENYLKKVKEYVNTNNLPVSIEILVPYKKMSELYLKNDVFVLPSIKEAASVSQLEAMSHGLAILCGSDNGTAYYVKPLQNGEIFNSEDFDLELEKKFRWILSDKKSIERMGKKSIEIVNENHSIYRMETYLLDIINEKKNNHKFE